MNQLNYHHLRYFWTIANQGNLTRAAKQLNVAQSALSTQLRQLEENLGRSLFKREHKSLVLTEAGKLALDYAEAIFRTGNELVDTLKHGLTGHVKKFRVGAPSTLSRNFQFEFLRPIVNQSDLEIVLHSGSLNELLIQLQTHTLDVILSNHPIHRNSKIICQSHLINEQEVVLVSRKNPKKKRFCFPEDLRFTPITLPSLESNIRSTFDFLMNLHGICPRIIAEVDDMAMLRLFARESNGVTLVPRVVVQDELRSGILFEQHCITQITEKFYAITPTRKFPNEVLKNLIQTQLNLKKTR